MRIAEPEIQGCDVERTAVQGADLRRALLRLNVEERLALFLYFVEDLPIDQAAQAMGLSVPAARSRIYRALKRLRPGLELREVAL